MNPSVTAWGQSPMDSQSHWFGQQVSWNGDSHHLNTYDKSGIESYEN
jgi:hypothetical protein